MREGASKQSCTVQKNSTAPGPRAPVLKFLDPPLDQERYLPSPGKFRRLCYVVVSSNNYVL